MLNRSASLVMSTSVLKALPGKLDIKTLTKYSQYIGITISAVDLNNKGFSLISDLYQQHLKQRFIYILTMSFGNDTIL